MLKEFIELNYKKFRLTYDLTKTIAQNREVSSTLMAHYDIERELEHPIVEYAHYVLTGGSDDENRELVGGIKNELVIKNESIKNKTRKQPFQLVWISNSI